MKTKIFIAILERLAGLYQLAADQALSVQLADFATDLGPFSKGDLPELFLKQSDCIVRAEVPEGASSISMRDLREVLLSAGELLKSAGAGAKAKDVIAAAEAFGESPMRDTKHHVAQLAGNRERAALRVIEEETKALVAHESELAAFEAVLKRVGKLPPDAVSKVAFQYVQGRPKYPTKAKALAAIRDKRYERAQLRLKMQG